jgi:hypothetical protein
METSLEISQMELPDTTASRAITRGSCGAKIKTQVS